MRNFSTGDLEMGRGQGGYGVGGIAYGEAVQLQPGSATVEFTLGRGADRVAVSIVIGTLRFAERGTIRVSAQAIVRQAPAPG